MEEQPTRSGDEMQHRPVGRRKEITNRQDFDKKVHIFSHASVYGKHYDPFRDIPWDDPEYAIDPDDDRWILGPKDNLGAHEWYQNLPRDEKIRVGLFRFANAIKTGSQFEMQLNAGIMHRSMELPNGIGEEFRYPLHEAGEEVNHIQMFQKFVDRTGVDTNGAPAWFRNTVPYITPLANKFPVGLWALALAGEEPVDHMQKTLRKETDMHPLLDRIMKIHIDEEARHINFAHTYFRGNVPRMSRSQKAVFSVLFPVLLRGVADVIMRPSREAQAAMGIPKEVVKEVWWDSDNGREFLSNLFPDVRKLADELGLRGKVGRATWRAMGIDASED